MFELEVEVKFSDAALYDGELRRAKAGDAAIDLRSAFDVTIPPGETVSIKTGVSVHVDNPNACALVVPRSGLGGKQGLVLGNLVGVIDSGYQGEIICFAWNRNERETGKSIELKRGDRFAQLMFVPILVPTMKVVEQFTAATERGEGGFGSTGV